MIIPCHEWCSLIQSNSNRRKHSLKFFTFDTRHSMQRRTEKLFSMLKECSRFLNYSESVVLYLLLQSNYTLRALGNNILIVRSKILQSILLCYRKQLSGPCFIMRSFKTGLSNLLPGTANETTWSCSNVHLS